MVYVSSCSPKIGLSAALFAPGFLYENLYMDQLRSLASTSSEYINMTSNENSDTYRHLSQELYVDSHTMDTIYRSIEDQFWMGYKTMVNSKGECVYLPTEKAVAPYVWGEGMHRIE